jgi:hypothetical protein
LSTRFQLDKAHAALNVTEKRINRAAPAWAWGWTLLAAGVSGIAGSVYSYMQVRNATDGYNSAALTSEAQAYRGYVMLWGTLFGISAGIGVGGTALGGLVLGVAPGPLGLVRERDELRQRIKLLSEQAASEAARNPLFSRSVQ